MPRKPKRSDAQKEADARYAETNRRKNLENQKAKYKSRTATMTIEENAKISKIYKKHKMTNADALRVVAFMLENGLPLPKIEKHKITADSTATDTPPEE